MATKMSDLEKKIRETASRLAKYPTTSNRTMWDSDRIAGIDQMLKDLYMLAHNDGCIAAAWAYEFAMEILPQLESDATSRLRSAEHNARETLRRWGEPEADTCVDPVFALCVLAERPTVPQRSDT